MNKLNRVLWYLVFFLILTIAIAIVGYIFGEGWLSLLVALNFVSIIVITEMIKYSFYEDVLAYRDKYLDKVDELNQEKEKLHQTQILLSNYIEKKIKARERVQKYLDLKKSKQNEP